MPPAREGSSGSPRVRWTSRAVGLRGTPPLIAGYVVSTLLFWIAGGALGWASWRREDLERNAMFHLGGSAMVAILGLASLVTGARLGPLFLVLVWGSALGFLVSAPFAARVLWFLVDALRRWMAGEGSVPSVASYDQAEAFEKRRQWDRAIRVYKDALAQDPRDAVARARIAEIEAGRGRFEEAASWYRAALPYLSGPRERATAAFRLADLERESARPEEARRVLEDFASTCPDPKLRDGALRRLEGL